MGNGSNKRRATGEAKAILGFKMGFQEDNRSSERVPLKVWSMLTPEAQSHIRDGGEVKIGIVKEVGVKDNRRGGGKFSKYNKNLRNKLLRLFLEDVKQNPAVIKGIDELI